MQTFRKLREEDCYYVDKTPYIERLLDEGSHYFLSRPRRFGKSLFLDTLKELFEGNEALFTGLHIHDRGDWNWSVRHPVVRLDFAGGSFKDPGYLQTNLAAQLDGMELATGVSPRYDTAPERFGYLIRSLHELSGQRVAVLVDEYDKPILDALETPEIARANRDYLRGLYGVIKARDAHVRFTFVTGVSKFTKVSLFSDLNNLTDITLDPAYSSICGYTEGDLETVFAPELAGLDRERVREWYNGYSWLGAEKVYNPYDVLLLLRRRKFAAHWFETGTPAFLVDTLFERRVASVSLDEMMGTEELLSAFDVGRIGTEALLFQTGYLTITGGGRAGRQGAVSAGLPQPGGAPEPERASAAPTGAGHGAADGQQHAVGSTAGGARLCGAEGAVPCLLREHSVPVVHEQPDRRLRGVLRERVLLLLCGAGLRDRSGGVEQPRAAGHGGAHRRARVSVRVQGGGDGAARVGAGAAPEPGLRGQVPSPERADPAREHPIRRRAKRSCWAAADPLDRGGVQPRDAQRDGVRGGRRLRADAPSREQPEVRRCHADNGGGAPYVVGG